MEKDVFCKIVAGEIPSYKIWEDEYFMAFLDVNPIKLGHTLLVPKKHHEYLFDYEDKDYDKIFKIAKYLAPFIQKATEAKKIGMVVEGFGVPHLHLHLVPLYTGGDLNLEKQYQAEPTELKDMSEKITSLIK